MNKVILIGRLTRDPEYRDGENPFCRYTLAVDNWSKDKEADFINCVAFKRNAEIARDNYHKGIKIAISGRIQTGKYTNKDGQTIHTTDVVIESQEFCESKKKADDDLPPWLQT